MIKALFRLGLNRGILGGNRFLTMVAVVTGALRLIDKFMGNEPKTMYSQKLKPGQVLVISEPADKR